MKVGFTGTRRGMTEAQKNALWWFLLHHPRLDREFHHGDCIGADAQAHLVARSLGFRIVVHPPASDTLRAWCEGDEVLDPAPYLRRNRAIVDACDVLIACPGGPEVRRSGTWATIRYAQSRGAPLVLIRPDPDTKIEGFSG